MQLAVSLRPCSCCAHGGAASCRFSRRAPPTLQTHPDRTAHHRDHCQEAQAACFATLSPAQSRPAR